MLYRQSKQRSPVCNDVRAPATYVITSTGDAKLFRDYTASGNVAVRCHLSIIDALVEAQQIQATGEAVKVIAAD